MNGKRFVGAAELTRDSFLLAKHIFDSGWLPHLLVALWRGGSPIGIAVHEFLLYKGVRTEHAVITCGAYSGIGVRGELQIKGLEPVVAGVVPGQRVLLVDDIFDSGLTADALVGQLATAGADVRVATLFWKPSHNRTSRRPDYHLHVTSEWVVFPHELEGLSPEDIRRKDPALHQILFEHA